MDTNVKHTPTMLEQQVREALAIMDGGTDYERLHVKYILQAGLDAEATRRNAHDALVEALSVLLADIDNGSLIVDHSDRRATADDIDRRGRGRPGL